MQLPTIIKDFTSVAFGASLARGIALVNTVIIARLLGPTNYGIFSIFYSIMILSWQLPQSFDGVFVSLAKKTETKTEKIEYLKSSITFKFLYLFAIITLCYPLSLFLGKYCFGKENLTLPIIYAFLCGALLTFLMTIASTFQEEGRFANFALVHAIYTSCIFFCLLILLVVEKKPSLYTIISIYLFISILIGIFSIKFLLKKTGNLLNINRRILTKSFKLGKWFFLSISSFCIFSRIDILFLPRFVSYENLGQYAVATQLVSVVSLAAGPLAGICLPRASLAIHSKESFKHFVKESIFAVFLIELGIILFFILSPYIVIYFYGNEYFLAIKALRFLLIGWMFGVVFIPFSFLFIALEDTRTRFFIEFSKLLTCLFLLYVLVPSYGILGAASAFSLTLFISLLFSIYILRYRLKTNFTRLSL